MPSVISCVENLFRWLIIMLMVICWSLTAARLYLTCRCNSACQFWTWMFIVISSPTALFINERM
ncbi:hypothetical protein F4604DRAFT_1810257 [Suillus subluteus]|nr:hypothetical protein F4604DRAFT_1810257 [Suillus subluteus]